MPHRYHTHAELSIWLLGYVFVYYVFCYIYDLITAAGFGFRFHDKVMFALCISFLCVLMLPRKRKERVPDAFDSLIVTSSFLLSFCLFLAEMGSASTTATPQLTVPNSMSSSYDRDESSDEADDQPVVADDVALAAAPGSSTHDLNNIKRILDQCHVLYKCKVDQHNHKVTFLLLRSPDRLASCLNSELFSNSLVHMERAT